MNKAEKKELMMRIERVKSDIATHDNRYAGLSNYNRLRGEEAMLKFNIRKLAKLEKELYNSYE